MVCRKGGYVDGVLLVERKLVDNYGIRIDIRKITLWLPRHYPINYGIETFRCCLISVTLAYLSNRDRKNHIVRNSCSAQNTGKSTLLSGYDGNE